MKKDFAYIVAATTLLVLSVIPMFDSGILVGNFGISTHSAWYTTISYMFIHANIIHLLLNAIMFAHLDLFFFTYIHDDKKKCCIYIASFVLAALFGFLFAEDTPTVGLSGFLFGVLGFVCSNLSKRNLLFNICSVVFYSLLGAILGAVNYKLHISCFAAMFLIGLGLRYEGKR